ncbi:MAG: hypothetical protein RL026_1562 [Pseudomonadota bacterium]|jgi:uncharacterized protein (TIGR00255 family)
MITSMTGFARSETRVPQGTLVCELRSVNHRFLEITPRLPEDLRSLEPELRAVLQRGLRRGKVDATLSLRLEQTTTRSMELEQAVLAQLRRHLAEVAACVPEQATTQVDLAELLRFPGLIREERQEPESLVSAARALLEQAVEALVSMRQAEGARLAETIALRCEDIRTLVSQVRGRLPQVQQAMRQRLEDRLGELRRTVDADRLEQELVLLAQRMDVAEELDRLEGHLAETRRILAGPEPAGRRLDFLMQEFNREANTLSSKSQDLETTRLAMEMKVLIEQMREQVQNIE